MLNSLFDLTCQAGWQAQARGKAVEPLVQALGNVLSFLHMKRVCLVELDPGSGARRPQ
jgi:hypothetical protein